MNAPELNHRLFEPKSWLAAGFVDGQAASFKLHNPANQQLLLELRYLSTTQIEQAISDASQAQLRLKALGNFERARLLQRWGELIDAQIEDLALILTLEQGKPLAEAKAELRYANAFIFWFAEQARRLDGFMPSQPPGQQLLVSYEAVGVCAAITPWNFPAAMLTRKAAAAIAAGCPVLIKPSELTPLIALALARLSAEAGFPEGVLQVLLAEAAQAGAQLTQDRRVRKLSFTGSTRVGRLLASQSAQHLQRLSLELGGNAPFIVCEDADLTKAIDGALAAKLRNNGQSCVAANRFLIHRSLIQDFTEALIERLAKLKIGPGWLPDTQLGPMIHPTAAERLQQQIQLSEQQGARRQYGGRVLGPGFIEPCVLSQVTPDMEIFVNENFGPLLPVTAFDSDDQAATLAQSHYGLAAYCYTSSLQRSAYYSQKLECGMLGINTGSISQVSIPFGGIKDSGYGREGSRLGLDDYLQTKSVLIGGLE